MVKPQHGKARTYLLMHTSYAEVSDKETTEISCKTTEMLRLLLQLVLLTLGKTEAQKYDSTPNVPQLIKGAAVLNSFCLRDFTFYLQETSSFYSSYFKKPNCK